ncbi:hypothetical protein MLD38_003451 [Melastoma candidum]|uniref:Uncharacterized protein n=1 Tax=Melastoma candidum TaxID=119954 RepID=A0ACB9S2R2_9MYRT|nr:hypothetical protein MLD38_003451 [Melastoma candidum]
MARSSTSTSYKRMKGGNHLRQKLLLATLSSTPIVVDDIRSDHTWPGLLPHEVSLLRLFERLCDDCSVEINETGTKFKYKPGIIMGGKIKEHDCGVSRSIGYFLEPLIVLGLFGKKPLSICLKGITDDPKDPSIDTFRSATLPLLKRFGVPDDALKLKLVSRGVPPRGGGEILLSVPSVQSLSAVTWTDEGIVKRIRGFTFSSHVPQGFEFEMVRAAREMLKGLLDDVFITMDHRIGPPAGKSRGYGISLVAETTSGCFMSSDTTISCGYEDEAEEEGKEKKQLKPPEDVSEETVARLLSDIKRGGVVDSTHQGLLFILCALCPQDVSKVRVGQLTPYGIETLRNISDFLGVKFDIRPDPSTETLILKCVGCGLKNLSRKAS